MGIRNMIPLQELIFVVKKKLNHKQFLLFSSVLIGISVGLAAYVLKSLLHFIYLLISNNSFANIYYYSMLPIIGILLTVYVKKKIYRNSKFNGLASLFKIIKTGATIPKNQMHEQIITSSLTVGFGGSAGVEAPIVLTGAAFGSNFSKTYRFNKNDKTLLLACGVAAGIGSAFNAPIAGVLFATEVLLIDVSIGAFIPLIMSAAVGALITKILLGNSVLLSFKALSDFQYFNTPFYILLGILSGFISLYHARSFTWIEKKMSHHKLPPYFKVFVGGIILALLIIVFPTLFGEGYESIKWLSIGQGDRIISPLFFEQFHQNKWFILITIGLLVFIKSIATALTIGSGGNGGNFAPSLFVGAYLGFFTSNLFNNLFHLKLPESNFTLVGMAGILSGLYHAPLTAIFLIAEITGGYTLMIPLMLVATISYAISRYFNPLSLELQKFTVQHIPDVQNQHIITVTDFKQQIDTDFISLFPNQTLGDLVELIKSSHANVFPVLDHNNKFKGLIVIDHIRELLFDASNYNNTKVKDLMIQPHIIASPDESIESILNKLDRHDYWFLPIIENEIFIGFITKNKILSIYRSKLNDTIIF